LVFLLALAAVSAVALSATTVSAATTTSQLTVRSQNSSGQTITGFHTVLYQAGEVIATGFTPVAFTLNDGQSYVVEAQSYGSCIFSHWSNSGTTSASTSISITSNTQITAVYNCSSSAPSSVTISSVDQNDKAIFGYYTVLYNSAGSVLATGFTPKTFQTTAGDSYRVRAESYGSCTFTSWSNGVTNDPLSFKAAAGSLSYTAVYDCTNTTPPTTSTVTVHSVNQNGTAITGFRTVLYSSSGAVVSEGFSPNTFTTTIGDTYGLRAESYGSCTFRNWSNGATSDPLTFTATSSAPTYVAVYNCGPSYLQQSCIAQGLGTSTSISCKLSSPVAAGQTILVESAVQPGSVIGDSMGDSYQLVGQSDFPGSTYVLEVFAATASQSGLLTVSIAGSGAFAALHVHILQGITGVEIVSNSSGVSTSASSGLFQPTKNSLIIATALISSNEGTFNTTVSAGPDYSLLTNGPSIADEYAISSGGLTSSQFGFQSAQDWGEVVVAFST
jgi:hypothetical protein